MPTRTQLKDFVGFWWVCDRGADRECKRSLPTKTQLKDLVGCWFVVGGRTERVCALFAHEDSIEGPRWLSVCGRGADSTHLTHKYTGWLCRLTLCASVCVCACVCVRVCVSLGSCVTRDHAVLMPYFSVTFLCAHTLTKDYGFKKL